VGTVPLATARAGSPLPSGADAAHRIRRQAHWVVIRLRTAVFCLPV